MQGQVDQELEEVKKNSTIGKISKERIRGMGKAPQSSLGYTSSTSDEYLRGRRDALGELRASGGVARSVLALQVLFCLPDNFVAAYEELWDRATAGDVGAVGGKGVEQDKGSGRAPGKKNGIVLGSESGLQAAGGGKKWKRPTDLLGSDKALRLKTAVDKDLDDLAVRVIRELGAIGKPSSGDNRSDLARRAAVSRKCKGSGCGRFLKAEYRFCPACGTKAG